MKQKVLSLLLTVAMVFSLVPATAFAEDTTPDSTPVVGQSLNDQLQVLENEANDLADMTIFEDEGDDAEELDELDQSFDNLNQTVAQNATDVLTQVGVAFTTGAALTATRLAAVAVNVEVNNLQRQYDRKEAQIAELEQKIQEANDAIEAAQDDVDAAEAALEAAQAEVDALPGLEEAQEQLSTAEEALEEAERIVAELEAIIAELDPAKAGIDTINGDAADDEKAAAKKTVTEKVFADDDSFSWVDESQLIFTAGGEYYQAEEATGEDEVKYVQFRKLNKDSEDATAEVTNDDLNNLKNNYANLPAYNRTYKQTGFTAVENDSTSYDVVAELSWNRRTLTLYVLVGSSVVRLDQAQNGWSFTTRGTGWNARTVRHTVSLVTMGKSATYTPTEEILATTSVSATGAWDEANAQLPGAKSERDAAQETKDTAEAQVQNITDKIAARDEAQATLDEAEKALEEATAYDPTADEEALAGAKQELKDINKDLNGNILEQLVVALIHGDEDEFEGALVNFDPTEYLSESDAADYRKYSASSSVLQRVAAGLLYTKAVLAVTQEAKEQVAPILEAISAVRENGLTLETAPAIYNLLTSTNLSAKTKQAIVESLSDYLGNTYESATETLQQVISDSTASTVEATRNVVSNVVSTLRNEGLSGTRRLVQSATSSLSRTFGRLFG